MRKLLLFALLLVPGALWSQDVNNVVLLSNGTPTGACPSKKLDVDYLNNLLYFCSNSVWMPATSGAGTGSVTSIATTTPITGGTITTTGTIACATCVKSAAALTSNAVVIGGGLQASSTISAATTTTFALFATAGAPAFRAIATGDLPIATSSAVGGVIPRDNLTVDSSGNTDFTPLDLNVIDFDEEFLVGSATNGSIGIYGWNINNIAGTSTAAGITGGGWPRVGGFLKLASANVLGNGAWLTINQGNLGLTVNLSGNTGWDSYFGFQFGSATGAVYRIGYSTAAATTVVAASGYYLRFDPSLGSPDTTLHICNDLVTVETCFDTTLAADTNIHKLRIRSIAAGTVGLTLDSGAETTICSGACTINQAPSATTSLSPAFEVVSNTVATIEQLNIDFWKFKARGLAR